MGNGQSIKVWGALATHPFLIPGYDDQPFSRTFYEGSWVDQWETAGVLEGRYDSILVQSERSILPLIF